MARHKNRIQYWHPAYIDIVNIHFYASLRCCRQLWITQGNNTHDIPRSVTYLCFRVSATPHSCSIDETIMNFNVTYRHSFVRSFVRYYFKPFCGLLFKRNLLDKYLKSFTFLTKHAQLYCFYNFRGITFGHGVIQVSLHPHYVIVQIRNIVTLKRLLRYKLWRFDLKRLRGVD